MKKLLPILLLLSCTVHETKDEFPYIYAPDSVNGNVLLIAVDTTETYYKYVTAKPYENSQEDALNEVNELIDSLKLVITNLVIQANKPDTMYFEDGKLIVKIE